MKIHPSTETEHAWVEFDAADLAEIARIAQELAQYGRATSRYIPQAAEEPMSDMWHVNYAPAERNTVSVEHADGKNVAQGITIAAFAEIMVAEHNRAEKLDACIAQITGGPQREPSLDMKFRGVILKNKNGSRVPDDQWIVFLAKDNAVPAMLLRYVDECVRLGAAEAQIAGVLDLIDRVTAWRAAHPELCKVPDVQEGELRQ